jgi:prepilin-type N-terminal cleavage/methylation domain-containing protein
MKKLMPKPRGFTIIEVIIVLVVGAVIMLAVFLVVPQLQQSARNSRRRSDAQRILVATRQCIDSGQCTANVGGDGISTQAYGFLGETLNDPLKLRSDNKYFITLTSAGSGSVGSTIYVRKDAKCSGTNTNSAVYTNNPGSIALVYIVEPFKVDTTLAAATGQRTGNILCIND